MQEQETQLLAFQVDEAVVRSLLTDRACLLRFGYEKNVIEWWYHQ